MTNMAGPGLYTAGVSLGPTGGALVIVEKRPRLMKAVPGDREYEDVLAIVWHEQFSGRLTTVADAIAVRLKAAPLRDECAAYMDVSELGMPARRLLADRDAYAVPVVIDGAEERRDEDHGRQHVALRALQSRATVAIESGRLVVLERLPSASSLLRGLENLAALPVVGPARDVTIAGALAVWAAERHATRGPWASSKSPLQGSPEHELLTVMATEARDEERARARRESEWWIDPDGAGEL